MEKRYASIVICYSELLYISSLFLHYLFGFGIGSAVITRNSFLDHCAVVPVVVLLEIRSCLPRLMLCFKRFDPALLSPLCRYLGVRLSSTQLFIGGLCYDTNETILKSAFEKYGQVIEAKVICDRVSGRSRGYGFVRFASETEASNGLKMMDGQVLEGRSLRVHYAHRG